MKLNQNLANILLAVYLIGVGLIQFIPSLSSLSIVLSVLAIAAGVLMLLGSRGAKLSLGANLGWLLLAIWLIATGVLAIVKVNIPSQDVILAALAIVAGALLLLRR